MRISDKTNKINKTSTNIKKRIYKIKTIIFNTATGIIKKTKITIIIFIYIGKVLCSILFHDDVSENFQPVINKPAIELLIRGGHFEPSVNFKELDSSVKPDIRKSKTGNRPRLKYSAKKKSRIGVANAWINNVPLNKPRGIDKDSNELGLFGRFKPSPGVNFYNPGQSRGPRSVTVLNNYNLEDHSKNKSSTSLKMQKPASMSQQDYSNLIKSEKRQLPDPQGRDGVIQVETGSTV